MNRTKYVRMYRGREVRRVIMSHGREGEEMNTVGMHMLSREENVQAMVQHVGAQVEENVQQQNGHDLERRFVGMGLRGAK